MNPRARRWLLAGLCVALTGCSVLGLAYRNADRLIVMYADRWLDLGRTQERVLRDAVRARLSEHRTDELPQYSRLLRELREAHARGLQASDLEHLFGESRRLWRLAFARSVPVIAGTLASLDADQVQHLAERLASADAEYREELAADAERHAERVEDLVREVERWTGRLGAEQRATIATLVEGVPDTARDWEAHRQARQQALLDALRAGADQRTLAGLLQEWWLTDTHLDPALMARWAENRRLYAAGLAALARSLDEHQRARVEARLTALLEDLERLPASDHWARVDRPGGLFYNGLAAP